MSVASLGFELTIYRQEISVTPLHSVAAALQRDMARDSSDMLGHAETLTSCQTLCEPSKASQCIVFSQKFGREKHPDYQLKSNHGPCQGSSSIDCRERSPPSWIFQH